MLIQSYGRFLVEDLGDPRHDDAILSRISQDLAFAAAQRANIDNRLGWNETRDFAPHSQRDMPALNATLVDKERQRLEQDSCVTYAIIAILALVFVANAWALTSTALCREPRCAMVCDDQL